MALKTFPQIELPNDPAAPLQAGTKQYIDNAAAGKANASHTHAESDVTSLTTDLAGKVGTGRQILAGTGLTGGGDLTADRTLTVAYGTSSTTACVGNDSRIAGAVQTTRQVLSGTGLTGGGDLTADRTLVVAYGTSGTTACVGNDSRLSDSRTPLTHSHAESDVTSLVTDLASKVGSASPTFTGLATFSDAIVNTPFTLTDAATITVDASQSNHFRVTLAAAGRTMANPTNLTDGQKILFEIIQDGTGSRTITTWSSTYAFGTDVPSPTLTTTASKRDFIGFVYNSTAAKLYCIAFVRGY